MSNSGIPITQDAAFLERAKRIAGPLYPHQIEGVAFLMGRRRALLADDMGLGKTRQSVVAMTEAEPEGPYLVVCPASVKLNWKREILIALPVAEVSVTGPADLPDPGFKGWVIINYDLLGKHGDRLMGFGWRGLIFDEAHYLKNYQSQRSRLSGRLVRSVEGDPVVHALTGTPLTSRPRDLFPLLQLIDHPLGRNFRSFARRYCEGHEGEYGYVADGASHIDELTVQLHGVMLRRTKDETLDLPPKIRTWLELDLPQKRLIETMNGWLRELITEEDEPVEGHDRRDPALAWERGRRMGRLTTARNTLANIKTAHTIEFVEGAVEQGEKVVVFSAFREPIQRMVRHFGDRAAVIHGGIATEERQRQVDRFQTDDAARVLIANLHVAGVGLNLTAARQVVFNDLDWVPVNHWQAEDRVYRIGQSRTVNITYMTGKDTIDAFVRAILETKTSLIDDLVEGKALGGAQIDVIGELKRMLRSLSIQARDLPDDEASVADLLRRTSDAYSQEAAEMRGASAVVKPYSEEAIRTLARVLSGPARTRYRVASSSKPGTYYTIEITGADLACDCPGFSYRGNCQHTRTLKDALVAGKPLPDGYAADTPITRL